MDADSLISLRRKLGEDDPQRAHASLASRACVSPARAVSPASTGRPKPVAMCGTASPIVPRTLPLHLPGAITPAAPTALVVDTRIGYPSRLAPCCIQPLRIN